MELEKRGINMAMEDIKTKTYEELLIGRISKAFEAMDNTNQDFFDEIIDEIEMLFKLKPEMYSQLLEWKKYHQGVAEQAFRLAAQKIGMLEGDDIAQRITKQYYTNHIEWSYRKDMLESMINILNAFKMIPFSIPDYAEIESGEEATIESAPPEPEPTIEEEPPMPQIQRPAEIHSPTYKPTNVPKPQQRQVTAEDVEIARAKAEAKEIERMAQLPKNQTPVKPAPPPKKRFGGGLFKTE
jgi:hypothetical protein